MLQQGFDANATDYDSRTALMLACVKGHSEVVSTLLAAGADPSKRDHLGGHALLEACKQGHDELIDRLKDPDIWCAPHCLSQLVDSVNIMCKSSLCRDGTEVMT